MTKLVQTVCGMVRNMPVYAPDAAFALGMEAMSERTRFLGIGMLEFLVKAKFCTSELTDKQISAIHDVILPLSVDLQLLIHICFPGCPCCGEPAKRLLRTLKVS